MFSTWVVARSVWTSCRSSWPRPLLRPIFSCAGQNNLHDCATMRLFVLGVLLLPTAVFSYAASLFVSNASFQSPETDFASPFMDSWEKAPQPFWYTDTNFLWFQLMGQFMNTSNGSPDHIDNVEGSQAAYLF